MDTFDNKPQDIFEPSSQDIPADEAPEIPEPPVISPPDIPPCPVQEQAPSFEEPTAFSCEPEEPITYDSFAAPTYHEPGYETYAAPKPQESTGEKPPKKGKGLKIAAACLGLLLIGGIAGGIIAGIALGNRFQKTSDHLQAQINALTQQGSTIIHTASTPSGSASSGDLYTPAQVYETNVASVVSVTTTVPYNNGWTSGTSTGAGSGFILTSDGYILTNYHVIEGASSVRITTTEHKEYEAEVVGYDAFSDVALLKVDAHELPYVVVGDSDALRVGDMVAAIGNPLGELASTQTVGYVSAKNRMVNTDGTTLNMIQTDAAINSGNSGGPLFNMYGQVIGITTAKYSGSTSSGASIEGTGFAIPINTVMDLVDDLMEHGYVTGQAYLGISVLDMDADVAAAYGLPAGPKVDTVTEGSCAEKAGLKVGDIITGLGELTVESYADLAYALRTFRAGDTTQIHIFRAGQVLSLTVTFDEKPLDTSASQETEPQQQQQNSSSGSYGYSWPFFPFP